MPDQPTFVVNDRRKFTAEGEPRHDPAHTAERPAADAGNGPQLVAEPTGATAALADLPESQAISDLYPDQTPPKSLDAAIDADFDIASATGDYLDDASLPPGPTAEQAAEATRAYEATVDRLDTAMRAANPGGERVPPMTFERLIQSLYTQALILLGGGAQPGETPRVDILGARETIDMLAVIASKSTANLAPAEDKLLQSALFDLRMGFLEITQALARQAAQRAPAPGTPGNFGPPPGGPRIVR